MKLPRPRMQTPISFFILPRSCCILKHRSNNVHGVDRLGFAKEQGIHQEKSVEEIITTRTNLKTCEGDNYRVSKPQTCRKLIG